MAIPDEPLTRSEQYLAKAAGQDVALPNVPLTRTEQYLAKIAGQDVAVPDVPLTRMEQYLAYIAENGSGGGGNPNTQQTVAGTADNPWGSVSYSELAEALANGDAHAILDVQMGAQHGILALLSFDGQVIWGGNANLKSSLSESSVASFNWKTDGSINYVRTISGGQFADMTAYAAGMSTVLQIYWHPMPEGGD